MTSDKSNPIYFPSFLTFLSKVKMRAPLGLDLYFPRALVFFEYLLDVLVVEASFRDYLPNKSYNLI